MRSSRQSHDISTDCGNSFQMIVKTPPAIDLSTIPRAANHKFMAGIGGRKKDGRRVGLAIGNEANRHSRRMAPELRGAGLQGFDPVSRFTLLEWPLPSTSADRRIATCPPNNVKKSQPRAIRCNGTRFHRLQAADALLLDGTEGPKSLRAGEVSDGDRRSIDRDHDALVHRRTASGGGAESFNERVDADAAVATEVVCSLSLRWNAEDIRNPAAWTLRDGAHNPGQAILQAEIT
jgi:hypothetical protein